MPPTSSNSHDFATSAASDAQRVVDHPLIAEKERRMAMAKRNHQVLAICERLAFSGKRRKQRKTFSRAMVWHSLRNTTQRNCRVGGYGWLKELSRIHGARLVPKGSIAPQTVCGRYVVQG